MSCRRSAVSSTFQLIISAIIATSALVAAAPAPELVKRTSPSTSVTTVNSQCNGQTLKCCESFAPILGAGILGAVGLLEGLTCTTIALVDIPIGSACSQKVACCEQQGGPQSGLVNVQNVCVPVNVL